MTRSNAIDGPSHEPAARRARPAGLGPFATLYVTGWLAAGLVATAYIGLTIVQSVPSLGTGPGAAVVAWWPDEAPDRQRAREIVADEINSTREPVSGESLRERIAELQRRLDRRTSDDRAGAAAAPAAATTPATAAASPAAIEPVAGADTIVPADGRVQTAIAEPRTAETGPPLPVRAPRITTASTTPAVGDTRPAAAVQTDSPAPGLTVTLPDRIINAALEQAAPTERPAPAAPSTLSPPAAAAARPVITFGTPVVTPAKSAAAPANPGLNPPTASAADAPPPLQAHGVEIAIAANVAQLRQAWRTALDRNYQALATLEPRVRPAGQQGGPVALLAGPISSLAEAQRLCERLRSVGQPCEVSDFGGKSL